MSRKSGAQHKGKKTARAEGGLAWSQAQEGAKGLLEILQQSRGPARGVGVSIRVDPADPTDTAEKAMLRARAVGILLAEHPEIQASVWNNDAFLSYRMDMALMSKSEAWQQTDLSIGVREGDDLVVRTAPHRARKDEVLDTYPRYPGALEGKQPYEADEEAWSAWREGLKAYREREAARVGGAVQDTPPVEGGTS